MFYSLLKRILFLLDPEKSNKYVLRFLKHITGTPLEWLFRQSVPMKIVHCMGLSFKNPIGLAAGFDKNGDYIDTLGAIGFGFIEVGTVTPNPQPGNKPPRIFRLPKTEGLINCMGYNNLGVDYLVENIKKSNFNGIIGVNISKNKNTPLEKSKDDYLICMEKVYQYAGYIAVNISSPNTPELRIFQCGDQLDNLLIAIKKKQLELKIKHNKYVPVTLKITPDINEVELIKVADSLIRYKIDGVIAVNTTINRKIIYGIDNYSQIGGLSGKPIQFRSTEVIKILNNELKNKVPIIGVGGIDSLVAAREKLIAGASLLQIYSGLIFHGPKLIKNIIKDI